METAAVRQEISPTSGSGSTSAEQQFLTKNWRGSWYRDCESKPKLSASNQPARSE